MNPETLFSRPESGSRRRLCSYGGPKGAAGFAAVLSCLLCLPPGQPASAAETSAAPAVTSGRPPALLVFPVTTLEGVGDDLAARLDRALGRSLSGLTQLAAFRLSPELPALKRAVREKRVAPQALENLTSTTAREVLCQALGFPFGLVVDKLQLSPAGHASRTSRPELTGLLLRADGEKPRVVVVTADKPAAGLKSLSDAVLGELTKDLLSAAAAQLTAVQAGKNLPTPARAEELLQQAAQQMAEGKYRLAISTYNLALRFQPRNDKTYFLLGNACAAAGNLKSAVVHYKQALYLRSDNTEAAVALARTYRKLGELKHMLDTCRKLVRKAPEVAEHQRLLGEALLWKRRALSEIGNRQGADAAFAEARKAYERAIALADDKLEIIQPYARLLFEDDQYSAAVETVRKGLQLRPDDRDLHRLLWRSLLFDRQYEEAVHELLSELATDPSFHLSPEERLYRKIGFALDRQARQAFIAAERHRQDFAAGKLSREEFLKQTQAFQEEADRMVKLLDRIDPPKRLLQVHAERQLAFVFMSQWAVKEHRYVETLDETDRLEAVVCQKHATDQFNRLHALERRLS